MGERLTDLECALWKTVGDLHALLDLVDRSGGAIDPAVSQIVHDYMEGRRALRFAVGDLVTTDD